MLVICRSGEVWLSAGNSRYLAHEIPDSQLVELRGVDHGPWVGDDEQVLTAVEAFVAGLGRPYGVAAGVRQGTSGYLKVVWVPSR